MNHVTPRTYGRLDEAVEVVRRGLGHDLEAGRARGGRRLRADRHDGHRAPVAASARAADAEASRATSTSGGSRPQLDRAVERHEVGAELVDEQRPRALGAREQHAARRRGSSASSPSCVDRRDEVGATRARSAAAVPGPIAASGAAVPPAPRELARAVRGS